MKNDAHLLTVSLKTKSEAFLVITLGVMYTVNDALCFASNGLPSKHFRTFGPLYSGPLHNEENSCN